MTQETPWSFAGNLIASPIYGIGETLAGMGAPGAQEFLDWGVFDGVEDFRYEHPGWALGAEVASYLVPGAGWARATGKGLGAVGALTRAGANLGGRSATARFALGETARWLPFNTALTAFDAAGGRYESAGQAGESFVLSQALGLGLSAGGASRGFQRLLQQVPIVGGPAAGVMKAAFGPSPENRALYGMGPAAEESVSLRNLTSQFDATEPFQLWGRQAMDILGEVRAGTRTDIEEGDVLNLMDLARRESLNERVAVGEQYVNLPYADDASTARFLNREFTPGQASKGSRVRSTLTRDIRKLNDIGKIGTELSMPEGWEFMGRYYRHIESSTAKNGENFRKAVGLDPSNYDTKFRRIERNLGGEGSSAAEATRAFVEFNNATKARRAQLQTRLSNHIEDPQERAQLEAEDRALTEEFDRLALAAKTARSSATAPTQTWSIRHEEEGMWVLATEITGGDKPRFLMFKTDQPDFFFPGNAWAKDIDNPGNLRGMEEVVGQKAWDPVSALPENVSPFFDHMRSLKQLILSSENFRALARGARTADGGKDVLMQMLGGDKTPPGLSLSRIVDAYLKPTMFQFRNNPLAAQVYQMRRAVFDAADGMKQELMYGKQSLDPGSPIMGWKKGIYGKPDTTDQASIYSEARHWFENPKDLEEWRRLYFEERLPLEEWPEGPAKSFQTYAKGVNDAFINEMNTTLKAIGENPMKIREGHIGVGHNFSQKGSNHYPVYDQDNNVVAMGSGHSAEAAMRDAKEWIEWKNGKKGDSRSFHLGEHFTAENFAQLPRNVREAYFTPGFYMPRSEMGGFRWEREEIKDVEELIQAFDQSYAQRSRLLADRVGKALTASEYDKLKRRDPATSEILASRLNQLKGVPGAIDKFQNRVLDRMLAPVIGTNSATKLANSVNEAMHHLTFGAGNLAYPLLNVTSLMQNALPEVTAVLASADDDLARLAYYLPTPGANGKPRGMTAIWNSIGSMHRAGKILKNPTDSQREIFDRLQADGDLGPRFAEEYLGQNAGRVQAGFGGLTDAADATQWLGAVSSFLPAQTEKLARAWSASMAIDAFEALAKIRGLPFNKEQMFRNVQNFVRRTNYLYATADRPAIFTTPAGSLFGGMKNWLAHYMFVLGDYSGMAGRKNWAPMAMSMASLMGLGGFAAMPFAMSALDMMTETFADQDAMEFLYENMGEGAATAFTFGGPAALGLSFSGNTAAPGAKLAHDIEFLGSIPAFERMQNMGRALGTYWDTQYVTGQDPWQNPVFRQQAMQGFAPRSMYRFLDSLDGTLNSAATGYQLTGELSVADQIKQAMGFTSPVVEREYAVYESLRGDSDRRNQMVASFGEAYFLASVEGRQDDMYEILQLAALRGLDQSSIMRSAQRRARDAGTDMFGRLRGGDISEYDDALGR